MNLYLGFCKKFLYPKANFVCQTGTAFVVHVNFIANKCQRKCRKSCDVVAKVSLEKITFEKVISNLAYHYLSLKKVNISWYQGNTIFITRSTYFSMTLESHINQSIIRPNAK